MWTSLLALAATALAEQSFLYMTLQGGPNSGNHVKLTADNTLAVDGIRDWTFSIVSGGLLFGQASCQGLLGLADDKATLAVSHEYVYSNALFEIADQKVHLNGVNNFFQCTESGNTIAWSSVVGTTPTSCSGATKVELLAFDQDNQPEPTGGDNLSDW